MIICHFHLQPQFMYELFRIYITSLRVLPYSWTFLIAMSQSGVYKLWRCPYYMDITTDIVWILVSLMPSDLTRPQSPLMREKCRTHGTMGRSKRAPQRKFWQYLHDSMGLFVKFYLKLNSIQHFRVQRPPGLINVAHLQRKNPWNAVRMLEIRTCSLSLSTASWPYSLFPQENTSPSSKMATSYNDILTTITLM